MLEAVTTPKLMIGHMIFYTLIVSARLGAGQTCRIEGVFIAH